MNSSTSIWQTGVEVEVFSILSLGVWPFKASCLDTLVPSLCGTLSPIHCWKLTNLWYTSNAPSYAFCIDFFCFTNSYIAWSISISVNYTIIYSLHCGLIYKEAEIQLRAGFNQTCQQGLWLFPHSRIKIHSGLYYTLILV